MLGDHGLFAKRTMLATSVGVPLIVMGVAGCDRLRPGTVDRRLAGLQDIMPTLLELAGLPCPDSCTGRSLFGAPRETLYCEALEGAMAMRMVTDGQWKLIWYPAGNRLQLFDRTADPDETRNLAHRPDTAEVQQRLTAALIAELYGEDLAWASDGALTGSDAPPLPVPQNRGLAGQRGLHYPEPPRDDPSRVVGAV
jgi:arylsulfatase A-like enzyme